MSAELFNAYADPSKARAISAGTKPSTTGVHAVCATVMQVHKMQIQANRKFFVYETVVIFL